MGVIWFNLRYSKLYCFFFFWHLNSPNLEFETQCFMLMQFSNIKLHLNIHEIKSNMDTKHKASQGEKERTKRSIRCCIMMNIQIYAYGLPKVNMKRVTSLQFVMMRDIRLLFYCFCPRLPASLDHQLYPATIPFFFFFFYLFPHTKNENKIK